MKTRGQKHGTCITAIGIALLLYVSIGSTTVHAAKAHSVHVGSPDGIIFGAGGDGNYSLVANMDNNGNVSGQWQDAFTRNPGWHMRVTCLTVVGNTAWIGGVITQASDNTLIGLPTLTKVVDNTRDGSGDTISFTFVCGPPCTDPVACSDMPEFLVQFPITAGNVTVR